MKLNKLKIEIIMSILGISIFFGVLSGCKTFVDMANYNDGGTALVVEYATIKAIEKSEYLTPEKVINFADLTLDSFKDSKNTSLDNVVSVILAKVPWEELKPTDRVLISGLIETVKIEIERRIDVGELNPESVTTAKKILGYVKVGAQMSL